MDSVRETEARLGYLDIAVKVSALPSANDIRTTRNV
jgi:hypothetical protein